MLWHYLTTAVHNLGRHRLATAMHILGLAFGLACFVVSFTFLDSLQHGEPHLATADRTYVLTQALRIRNAVKEIPASARTALPAYEYLKADFPQLAALARVAQPGVPGSNRITISSGEQNGFVYSLFADPDFLKIFNFKVLAGDSSEPFKDLGNGGYGSVITASAARRIFGTTSVVGRRVRFSGRFDGVISAVIDDVAQPSHLGDSPRALQRFDVLSRMPTDLSQLFPGVATDWTSPEAFIYLVLPADGSLSLASLRASLATFAKRHEDPSTGHSKFDVVPVSAVRQLMIDGLLAETGFSLTSSLYTLDALVLIVACFNYTNLATALALHRSREIALRKIVGARRQQLILQCIVEAAVVGAVALAVAIAVVLAMIPVLSTLLGQSLQPAAFGTPSMWLFLAGLTFATVTLAGVYPAVSVSRLQPVEGLRTTAGHTTGFVPRALIGLQFAVAGFLIVMVLIAQGQNRLMRSALVGIARNPTLVVTTNVNDTPVAMQTLRTRLLESPAVEAVSSTSTLPWGLCCWVFVVGHSPEAAAKAVQAAGNEVGSDYFNTVGIKLLAGRTFREASEDEVTEADWGRRPFNVVIDRKLSEQLGYKSPAAAIGATIYRPTYTPVLTLRIIGVVENAASHLTNYVGSSSDLYLFTPKIGSTNFPIIRFRAERAAEAVAHLEKSWKALAPGVPLEQRFMDELFEESYAAFGTVSQVATALTLAAFVIALMGLSGMAVQVTSGRLHEIGIRKTLGAKSRQIMLLLLFDFARPVVIANLIAWPFAYVAARAYVSSFLTPVPISPLVFLIALLASVIVACLVVCGQALRAARSQPAGVLRYE